MKNWINEAKALREIKEVIRENRDIVARRRELEKKGYEVEKMTGKVGQARFKKNGFWIVISTGWGIKWIEEGMEVAHGN